MKHGKRHVAKKRRRKPAPEAGKTTPGRFPVWDVPTRASHWAITVLFTFQFVTGHFGLGPGFLHIWAGYALLVTVVFRIQWGLVGSESARFSHFLATPAAIRAYLARLPGPNPTRWPGHNPLGGLSVLIMLALLLAQGVTGLFVETWSELRGPLAERVGRDMVIFLTDLHGLLRWPLLVLVGIHLAAALFYRLRKGEDRVAAIFTHGRLELDTDPGLANAGVTRALVVLALSLGIVGAVIVFGPVD